MTSWLGTIWQQDLLVINPRISRDSRKKVTEKKSRIFNKRIFNHRLDAVLLEYHDALHWSVRVADGVQNVLKKRGRRNTKLVIWTKGLEFFF